MSLQDRKVVVIGGSAGIGFAVAKLAREEHRLTPFARRTDTRILYPVGNKR